MNIEEVFEYNQHFVAMMNIINLAKLTNKEGQFEIHHIIPRCYFYKHDLPVDNSDNNLVKLTVEQHRKVHKLAALCATEEMKSSLKYAANLMNRESVVCENNPMYGCHHSTDTREKISAKVKRAYEEGRLNTQRENNGMFGKKPWNYGKQLSDESKKKISEAKKGCTISEETKSKISNTLKGRQRTEETKRKISETERKNMTIERRTKISKAMSEYRKTHPFTPEQLKKASESRRGKKRGKYKKNYTTWYIGPDGKRIYK